MFVRFETKHSGSLDAQTGVIGWAVVVHGMNVGYFDTEKEAKFATDELNDAAEKIQERIDASRSKNP